jgi:hypothetical protein
MLSAVTPSFVTKALRADSVLFNAETILPPNPDKPGPKMINHENTKL